MSCTVMPWQDLLTVVPTSCANARPMGYLLCCNGVGAALDFVARTVGSYVGISVIGLRALTQEISLRLCRPHSLCLVSRTSRKLDHYANGQSGLFLTRLRLWLRLLCARIVVSSEISCPVRLQIAVTPQPNCNNNSPIANNRPAAARSAQSEVMLLPQDPINNKQRHSSCIVPKQHRGLMRLGMLRRNSLCIPQMSCGTPCMRQRLMSKNKLI